MLVSCLQSMLYVSVVITCIWMMLLLCDIYEYKKWNWLSIAVWFCSSEIGALLAVAFVYIVCYLWLCLLRTAPRLIL